MFDLVKVKAPLCGIERFILEVIHCAYDGSCSSVGYTKVRKKDLKT